MSEKPHIMFVVGEPSGDLLGAQIIRALKDITKGELELSGMGGEEMERTAVASPG